MLKKITQIAQDMIKEKITKESICIDFTCGSGNDTLMLAQMGKLVHSYDIQQTAIDEARQTCQSVQNVIFHHKSHLYFDEDIQCFDIGIFNLGYYPKGDKTITTDSQTVISTLNKALEYLNHDGRIIIVCYPGFEHGYEESQRIETYGTSLPSKKYDVFRFSLMNRKNCPFIIGIEKH